MRFADVAIIGAGVVGAAIADTLARRGRQHIVLIERGAAGCEASNAAAGVLAVASAQARQGALLDLRRRSAAMFPDLVERLQSETGLDLGYRCDGLISLAFTDTEAADLCDLVRHRTAQGLRGEMLTVSEVRRLEPAVSPHVRAAAFFPDERSIDNQCLVRALTITAQQRGVDFREQTAVRSIVHEPPSVRLELDCGSLTAAVVIVAAGAWSPHLLAPCGIKLPVRPACGEMLAVRPTQWNVRHTLAAGDAYLVPRHNGELFVGSTTTFNGFEKQVTADGLAMLRTRAMRMVPRFSEAVEVRSWAGVRPCSTIRRPIIAPLPGMENVIVATGHHRNGILLAPITAQMVTEIVIGAPPTVPLRPFSYRRH